MLTCVRKLIRMLPAIAALALLWALPASAQTDGAALICTITDDTGTGLAGAEIVIVNSATGLARRSMTDADGRATIALLPPGRYSLTAHREGFAPIDVPAVAVGANERVAVNLQMKIAVDEAVVVTAQKRGEERLQDVPIPISVIDAKSLAGTGKVLLREYYATVPGLNLSPQYLARQQVSIRGVMTGGGSNPTVAITIDDVPNGASTDAAGASYIPDLDPGDLARIEVLRGPQGTLYGANSMGGLIRYVTVDPSFDGVSGRVEVGTNAVDNGATPAYTLRTSANLPVTRTLAMRVSAFTRQDPGYVDRPFQHEEGVNDGTAFGGRVSGLWLISGGASLKVSGMYQKVETNGSPEIQVLPGLGDLEQDFLSGTRGYDRSVQIYSALLKARLGPVEMTSLTGYNVNDQTVTDDRGSALGAVVRDLYGVTGVRYELHARTRKLSQEVRFAARLGRAFEWMAGGFYTNDSGPTHTTMTAEDTVTGRSAGLFYDFVQPNAFNEYAAFANLTYHVTDRFALQVGGRAGQQRLAFSNVTTGPYTTAVLRQPSPVVTPRSASTTSAATYLVAPQFTLSRDLMIYGRVASGYRPGGPNSAIAIAEGAPAASGTDRTQNYEIGIKGEFLHRALSVDAALYHIDWRDIQIGLRTPTAVYTANGGAAKSEGVELALAARPLPGLTISAWVAAGHAVLTQAFPATSTAYGADGDRLPFSTRRSGFVSLEQTFGLCGKAIGFAGGSASFVGARQGLFQATAVRQDLPAYTKMDLQAGLRRDALTVALFVNNLANRRGLLNGGIGYVPSNAFAYIQPRTIGLSVTRSF